MARQTTSEDTRQLEILEALEQNPEARQVDLAARMGMAVGTVNWVLKRLASKGYVKIKRIGQWHWRYLLTPQGLAQKARLTQLYLRESMRLYREIRDNARKLLRDVESRGFQEIELHGDPNSDLVDICRLTSLEAGLKVHPASESGLPARLPRLTIQGKGLSLLWPESENGSEP